MAIILHITTRAEWDAARSSGLYSAPSLRDEGFIHFSTARQVAGVANRFYRGRTGLVLLEVDTDRLTSPLKWEPPAHPGGEPVARDESDERFPHLYGPLAVDAVVRVRDYAAGADGAFVPPADEP